jgi:hypothetical protein
MLDPRIDLANMLHELREKLNEVEMKLWEIPHHAEPVQEYEAVFTAPAVGDYMHPDTPTHDKPEGFSDAAYWDNCCQCWMEPTVWEWDEYNYCDNANTTVSYESESNTWVETSDWSNGYADDWYEAPATVFVEEAHVEMHDEVHVETAPMPADMPETAPMPEDMPADMPETAPMPEDMPVDMPETAPMPEGENPEGTQG